jgi:16S rRNA (cytidine1402-2'-O)-methyltransferase
MQQANKTLFIIATPIGNLKDITLRALEVLEQVNLIAAEDTRHSSKLLQHYNIKTPIISLHNYNEKARTEFILTKLQQKNNIALISDAGTPLISDPGYHLVKTVRENNFNVIPIPGACAAITALCAAGLPTDKFIFEGFLPVKTKQQLEHLQDLCEYPSTLIFYESPHRILATIDNMIKIFGPERHAAIAKELTKIFENIYSNTLLAIRNWLTNNPQHQKGEFVILIAGKKPENTEEITPEVFRILDLLTKNLPPKKAATLTSQITGVNKNKLYKLLIKPLEC